MSEKRLSQEEQPLPVKEFQQCVRVAFNKRTLKGYTMEKILHMFLAKLLKASEYSLPVLLEKIKRLLVRT